MKFMDKFVRAMEKSDIIVEESNGGDVVIAKSKFNFTHLKKIIYFQVSYTQNVIQPKYEGAEYELDDVYKNLVISVSDTPMGGRLFYLESNKRQRPEWDRELIIKQLKELCPELDLENKELIDRIKKLKEKSDFDEERLKKCTERRRKAIESFARSFCYYEEDDVDFDEL